MRSVPRSSAFVVSLALCAHSAIASEPIEDDLPNPNRPLADLPTHEIPIDDLNPAFLPMLTPTPRGGAQLSAAFSMRTAEGRNDFMGSVVLEVPFDGFVNRKAKTGAVDKRPPVVENTDERADERTDDDFLDDGTEPSPRAEVRPTIRLPIIRAKDVRAAIAATSQVSQMSARSDALGDLASRARYSALLPTLRVRATRLVDESVSLSPTSYDADRTTSRGGASLWLEARATWDLDRLVFATEEVRVIRLQHDALDEQTRVEDETSKQLFAWQRAVYAMFDPTLPMTRCIQAWLLTQELAAGLDVATDGWFTQWAATYGPLRPSCVDDFEADTQR